MTKQEVLEKEVPMVAETGLVAILNKSEIDQQITTAHKFPRSLKQFRTDVLDMVTLSESIAQECIYMLPRDGKVIEGPSARFAEVIVSAWGNARAGARVVDDSGDFVTAQGVFHDLQRNVAITYEVQRRIVDRNGNRYKPDMVGVTANAACSIALRNAILKGIPKAFWSEMYEAAKATVGGDIKTLPTRRKAALEAFKKQGVSKDQVFAKLGIKGEEDIGLDQIILLGGILTAIKEGDTSIEHAFGESGPTSGTMEAGALNMALQIIRSSKTSEEARDAFRTGASAASAVRDADAQEALRKALIEVEAALSSTTP